VKVEHPSRVVQTLFLALANVHRFDAVPIVNEKTLGALLLCTDDWLQVVDQETIEAFYWTV
jgi:hypothetical protein